MKIVYKSENITSQNSNLILMKFIIFVNLNNVKL